MHTLVGSSGPLTPDISASGSSGNNVLEPFITLYIYTYVLVVRYVRYKLSRGGYYHYYLFFEHISSRFIIFPFVVRIFRASPKAITHKKKKKEFIITIIFLSRRWPLEISPNAIR